MENAVRASIGLTAWRATDNFVPINLMNISAERTVKQSSGSGCRFRRIGIVIWIIIWENRCGLLDALVRAAAIQSAIESICSIRPFILWPMPQIIRLRLWIVVLKQHWMHQIPWQKSAIRHANESSLDFRALRCELLLIIFQTHGDGENCVVYSLQCLTKWSFAFGGEAECERERGWWNIPTHRRCLRVYYVLIQMCFCLSN